MYCRRLPDVPKGHAARLSGMSLAQTKAARPFETRRYPLVYIRGCGFDDPAPPARSDGRGRALTQVDRGGLGPQRGNLFDMEGHNP